MKKLEIKGKQLILDDDGFLQDWEQWDEEVAVILAKDPRCTSEPIELTEEHWKIIRYIRSHYIKYGVAPPVRMLLKQAKKDIGQHVDLQYIYKLFPQGPAKDACRIAGLPKPTGCI
ncbi:MAG: dissimilatory sulfite reductase related protein [Archaeoglobaceae archaeon]|nr:dissimilatory sulfite reductase related protein [Archaeoglobaceae archaeon]